MIRLLLILNILVVIKAFSQNYNDFEVFSSEKGLTHTHILCVDQDTTGFLWAGTFYGLNKFNGHDFNSYFQFENDTNSLYSNEVHDILCTPKGAIWVGTRQGLNIYQPESDDFKRINLISEKTIVNIKGLLNDDLGNLWIATEGHGLLYFNERNLTTTVFDTTNSDIPSNNLNCVYLHNDQLYVGHGDKGLSVYNIKKDEFQSYPIIDKRGNELAIVVMDILISSKNELWLATWEAGLARFNGSYFDFFSNTSAKKIFANNNTVTDIKSYSENEFNVCTFGSGYYIFDSDLNEKFVFEREDEITNSISNNVVWTQFLDKDDILWLGTFEGGLNKTFYNKLKYEKLFVLENGVKKYVTEVSCYAEDDSMLWIGTFGNGIYQYNKFTNTTKKKDFGPAVDDYIRALLIDHLNRLWIGTNKGFSIVEKDKINVYNESNSFLKNKIGNSIQLLYQDSKNNIWLSAWNTGLVYIPADEISSDDLYNPSFKHYKHIEGDSTTLYIDNVVVICEDKLGDFWVSTESSLELFDSKKEEFKKYSRTSASAIKQAYDGRIWFTSFAEGLMCYNYGYDLLEDLNQTQSGDFTKGFDFDNKNRIWFTGEKSLFVYDNFTNEYFEVKENSGLPKIAPSNNTLKRLNNGKIAMGGIDGIVVFDPENFEFTKEPEPYINNLYIYNKLIKAGDEVDNMVLFKENLQTGSDIYIPPAVKSFTLEFSTINFIDPEKTKFAYLLEGFDTTWVETSAQSPIATYTNLDGKEYNFKVAVVGADPNWKDNAITQTIHVIPPYYKTLWFRFLVSFVTIGLIVLIALLRIRAVRKQNIYLEKMVAQRTTELNKSYEVVKKQADDLNETNTILEERQQHIEEQAEELKSQYEELAELNGMKDKLFSVIAHDLKNPFNIVLGFTDLLYSGFNKFNDDKKYQIIGNIRNSSHKIFDLLMDLLNWSRAQQGKIDYKPDFFEIDEVATNVISVVQNMADDKQVSLVYSSDNEGKAYFDIDLIKIVIRNLITNAIKFSNKGSKIEIIAKSHDEGVKVTVKDYGMGISEENIKKLFRKEVNFTTYGTNKEKGTGLGLLMCKDFIDLHNGEIWVESKEGEGSAFSFTIPPKEQQ